MQYYDRGPHYINRIVQTVYNREQKLNVFYESNGRTECDYKS